MKNIWEAVVKSLGWSQDWLSSNPKTYCVSLNK